jgi:hypothetical protein
MVRSYEKSIVFEWHKLLKEGRVNAEDDERIGYPGSYRTDENVEKVRNLVHSDRRLSIRAVAVQLHLDREMVGLNFGPMIRFSTMTVLQRSRCSVKQAVSGPKLDY